MAEQVSSNEIDIETFLKAAGQSFTDAQKALLPGLEVSMNMMLNSAELELKVAVNTDGSGRMMIRPISSTDLAGGIDPGLLSTIRIGFISSVGEISGVTQTPITPNGANRANVIPDLSGLTLDEAADLLKTRGWVFEPHAASAEEVQAAGEQKPGRVLRQQPIAGDHVDKSSTTVNFWVDLGNTPVEEIDGIGDKTVDNLSKVGIRSVGELSLADVSQIAALLRINEKRARGFVDMAALMSRLTVLGFKDEVVEVLVKGAGIRSVGELATANPDELLQVCLGVIREGKVKVPHDFEFTAKDVKEWIKSAGG
jgi:hypothetical protein